MTLLRSFALVLAVVPVLLSAVPASSVGLRGATTLRSYDEVPAISSRAFGLFAAFISDDGTSLAFSLVYNDLDGGSVTAAHIHLASPVSTAASWSTSAGPGGRPACPAPPATVTGTATSADVVAVPAQGIAAGDIAEVVRAIREGKAYVNVHTTNFAGGEIRGQIQ